ncbi:hypothetical protein ERO13_A05G133950v2 [Gossypium hirsutum]|nr:hypothetical protein ERO13_A05G133950v2 [Gossypium hirsutum]
MKGIQYVFFFPLGRDKCYLLKEHATRFWKQTAYISSDMVFSCTFSLPCNSSN